ncbi:alpha/beta hydrolase [Nocardioides dongxiaopingii]|uniref:alpha/beta hydrolase n=1 Tax=Nocardioides sp. S-1144 TaxID=2582905 RepID=UPI001162B8D6|nr:alpha/beta hydrolase [Nocardioides sp. S-1144]QCW50099.2 alpha/beta hydrolase [Nocardioides sp. S-1144]
MSTTTLVPVGDVELCVEAFGDPADPPVVLLAGAAGSMDGWSPDWCTTLAAAGRHVVRYDHRDTGRSTTSPPGAPDYDGGVLDRDAEGLLEALGLGPAHLVGVSMGGGIAQSVALRRPDLVASLTLVATSAVGGVDAPLPGPTPSAAAWFADPPPDPDWTDRDAVVAWSLAAERAFSGALGVDVDDARAAAGATFDRSHDVAAAGNHWLVLGHDDSDDSDDSDDNRPAPDVHHLAVPTLVVHGSHDPLFPLAHGEALAAAVPGARLLVVEGMGHQVPPRSTWDVVLPAIHAHTATPA